MATMIARMRARTAANEAAGLQTARIWQPRRADEQARDDATWAAYLRAVREVGRLQGLRA